MFALVWVWILQVVQNCQHPHQKLARALETVLLLSQSVTDHVAKVVAKYKELFYLAFHCTVIDCSVVWYWLGA